MLRTSYFKCIYLITFVYFVTSDIYCPFNSNCTCTDDVSSVQCNWTSPYDFPTFTEYNATIIEFVNIYITFNGESLIPPKAFYSLQSLQFCNIVFYSNFSCQSAAKLKISDNAFDTYLQNAIEDLVFQNIYFPKFPTKGLTTAVVGLLDIFDACIYNFQDYAFQGLTVNTLEMFYPLMATGDLPLLALSGINFQGDNSYLNFQGGNLTNIAPFKYTNSVSLTINNNNFANITEFAFCICNKILECNNSILQSVNLENNNIQFIADNAFANLPVLNSLSLASNNIIRINKNAFPNMPPMNVLNLENNDLVEFSATLSSVNQLYLANNKLSSFNPNLTYVNNLDLGGNKLTSVPSEGIQKLRASLTQLSLQNNSVQCIVSNSFYNCTSLQKIYLDYNPITTIEPGAFNGLPSVTTLSFYSLNQLNSADVLIAYGMSNLQWLEFQSCALESVYLSDPSKLPMSLEVIVLFEIDTLQEIDSNLEIWLKQSPTKLLYLHNLKQFPCNSNIQWMAPYAICQPVQIKTKLTACQDGSLLYMYLRSFHPSC